MKQREIKFRVFDKVAHEMSEPFALFGEFTLMGAVHDWQREIRLGVDIKDSLGMLNDLEVMQFTGLLDKDGKEIYEGDVIESMDSQGNPIQHIITWNESQWVAKYAFGGLAGWSTISQSWIDEFQKKIIGNVYTDPHLLKGRGETIKE